MKGRGAAKVEIPDFTSEVHRDVVFCVCLCVSILSTGGSNRNADHLVGANKCRVRLSPHLISSPRLLVLADPPFQKRFCRLSLSYQPHRSAYFLPWCFFWTVLLLFFSGAADSLESRSIICVRGCFLFFVFLFGNSLLLTWK